MKLGLVVQSGIELGGAHNYEAKFKELLSEMLEKFGHELVVFSPGKNSFEGAGNHKTLSFKSSPLRFAVAHLRANFLALNILRLIGLGKSNLEKLALKNKIDLLIFSSPNHLSPGIHKVPFVTTAWDFGHLDLPHFPETGQSGIWQWREQLYQSTVARSVGIFCDSDSTQKRLVQRYGADPKRVFIVGLLPFVPDSISPIKLDKPHFIYPAMFWPHKNHKLLVKAFAEFLNKTGHGAYLVLTGKGSILERTQKLVETLGISDRVRFEGIVPRDQLLGLIAGSRGLLMPSLLGPSNIPPLEAALLGVPVVASDVHLMGEMLDDLTIIESQDQKAWVSAFSALWSSKVPAPKLKSMGVEKVLGEAVVFFEKQVEPLI